MPESQEQAVVLSTECTALTIIATAKGIEAAAAMQEALDKCGEAEACWQAIINGQEPLPVGMTLEEVQKESRICNRRMRALKAVQEAQDNLNRIIG